MAKLHIFMTAYLAKLAQSSPVLEESQFLEYVYRRAQLYKSAMGIMSALLKYLQRNAFGRDLKSGRVDFNALDFLNTLGSVRYNSPYRTSTIDISLYFETQLQRLFLEPVGERCKKSLISLILNPGPQPQIPGTLIRDALLARGYSPALLTRRPIYLVARRLQQLSQISDITTHIQSAPENPLENLPDLFPTVSIQSSWLQTFDHWSVVIDAPISTKGPFQEASALFLELENSGGFIRLAVGWIKNISALIIGNKKPIGYTSCSDKLIIERGKCFSFSKLLLA